VVVVVVLVVVVAIWEEEVEEGHPPPLLVLAHSLSHPLHITVVVIVTCHSPVPSLELLLHLYMTSAAARRMI